MSNQITHPGDENFAIPWTFILVRVPRALSKILILCRIVIIVTYSLTSVVIAHDCLRRNHSRSPCDDHYIQFHIPLPTIQLAPERRNIYTMGSRIRAAELVDKYIARTVEGMLEAGMGRRGRGQYM